VFPAFPRRTRSVLGFCGTDTVVAEGVRAFVNRFWGFLRGFLAGAHFTGTYTINACRDALGGRAVVAAFDG
jgi:hypothetical protein